MHGNKNEGHGTTTVLLHLVTYNSLQVSAAHGIFGGYYIIFIYRVEIKSGRILLVNTISLPSYLTQYMALEPRNEF